jgi:hypothetical protein
MANRCRHSPVLAPWRRTARISPRGPAADWSDLAMAAVVAMVVLGILLLFLIVR